MMRQYHNLKKQYKDKILLFRMGDFFETFGKDAEIAARVLNITLTTRDKKDDPTPLAGFPHHALDQYLPKLIKAGYNVAVADQVEDPKESKGIVKREVVKIVTPGTLTEAKSLEENKNNYLAAITQNGQKYGLAICDLSTGQFQLTETNSKNQLIDEVFRNNPSEILIKPGQSFPKLSDYFIHPLEEFSFKLLNAQEILEDQLNVKSLASFGLTPYEAGIIASGAIIKYLQDTQFKNVEHIKNLKYYDLKGEMVLDRSTIKNLDLVYSEGAFGPKGTLFSVLDNTLTNMGGRKLRRWILHPLLDLKRIKFRQSCVNEFFNDPSLTADLQERLKQVADLERLSGKIGLNNANARDLLSLKSSLNKALTISKTVKSIKNVKKLSEQIETNRAKLKDCIKIIDKGIAENPPNTITEGEIIKDGYSEKIDEIRSDTKDSREWIKNLAEKERDRTGIPSLKVDSNKVFGYYIEVTNTHTDKVPDDYIRKQTLVNSERYITPELKKKEEIVFNAKEKLAELEYKCFLEIREKILKYIDLIQTVGSDIATIDVLLSLAEAARLNDYIRPDLYDMGKKDGIIDIKNSRHPVVEKYSDEEFIKNDVATDTDKNRLLILTGPNMSGKSTYIRQAALLILMAQIGSFVPAEKAEISIADRIFTRVGASDDIAGGRSTFLVEMDEASNIINNATQHSFIVLDEIGRGTSTYDGVSIAWAVSEFIHDSLGARCMFATHYHELLKLSELLEGVKNYNVAVIEKDDKITFLRKIEEGGTDKSYGIFVAQMAGLPESLIERAREILNGFEQENMFAVRSDPGSLSKQKDGKKTKKEQSAPNGDQLTFMDNSLAKTIPNVFKEIEEIDINHITPVQALKLIEKWKKTLDGK